MNVSVGVYQIQRPQANHFGKSERLGKVEENNLQGLVVHCV